MDILVTNDDGYSDSGINTLFNTLNSAGHRVFMIAPEHNKSAISAGLTIKTRLLVKNHGKNIWSVGGTPCDCIIVACCSDLLGSITPELIISGINDGGNLGTDIVYSGTCAAARQGAIYRIPSIALSMNWRATDDSGNWITYDNEDKSEYYKRLSRYVVDNLIRLRDIAKKDNCKAFVNINVFSFPQWRGEKFCNSLSIRKYFDKFIIEPNGEEEVARFYGNNPESTAQLDSDFWACSNGYIALSRILTEPYAIPF